MTTHTRDGLSLGSLGGIAAGLGRILFVRHGKGRGPEIKLRTFRPDYFDPMLADFERRFPEMRKRINVWQTGGPLPYLYDVKAVVFLLQDPLRELFPECYAQAVEIAENCRRLRIRMVNAPEVMSNTVKSVQSRLWRQAGFTVPVHYPFRSMMELRDASEFVKFPAVVMADRLHERSLVRVVQTRQELLQMDPESIVFPGSVAEFVDTREGYKQMDSGSDFARYYHKKRALVFGDQVRFGHLFFSPDPVVNTATSTLSYSWRLNPLKHAFGRWQYGSHIRIDNDFTFQDRDAEEAHFVKAAKALGLDIVAIDYSTFSDGRHILWDAKAHFPLHLWPMEILQHPRKVKQRHRLTHDVARNYFQTLLAS